MLGRSPVFGRTLFGRTLTGQPLDRSARLVLFRGRVVLARVEARGLFRRDPIALIVVVHPLDLLHQVRGDAFYLTLGQNALELRHAALAYAFSNHDDQAFLVQQRGAQVGGEASIGWAAAPVGFVAFRADDGHLRIDLGWRPDPPFLLLRESRWICHKKGREENGDNAANACR